MIPSRRSTDRAIHVRFQDEPQGPLRTLKFPHRLRCGYSDQCELRMPEGTGPDILFELNREGEVLHFSTDLSPERLHRYVDVAIDGKTINVDEMRLKPGSRFEIFDLAGRRQFSLVVDLLTPWFIRRRFLAVAVLILTVVGTGYAGYVYTALKQARQQLIVTEMRLERAEAGVERTESRVVDAFRRIESTEAQLSGAITELHLLQEASSRDIRLEFDRRLDEISKQARNSLDRLSEEDTQARDALEKQTQERIAALREDFSSKMVDTYQNFKDLEGRIFKSVKSQIKSLELEGEVFKRILESSRKGVVFIHTRYKVSITRSGETSDYNSFGTGFLVSDNGLGMTSQHVLFPWRYEREFLLLKELGLVEVIPKSVKWSIYLTGTAVVDEAKGASEPTLDLGYHSDNDERGLRFLYAPEINVSEELASTPAGMVMVPVPVPDSTDVAVFQLLDFDVNFDKLDFAESNTEPLDDVLAVGYPFSRLREGIAIPQAVRGFVRVVGPQVMELDTPLHPGLSGGPILNREGRIIGMAMAVFQSDVYGLAVHGRRLDGALQAARAAVRKDEQRLAELGCHPGKVDGHIDQQTQKAFRCEQTKTGQ